MAENNEREETCKLNDSIASWLVFIMVAGVIGCTLFYMVYNLCSSPDIQHVVIRVEKGDSISQGISAEESYTVTGIDSLIKVVRYHERELEEKYQYLLEGKEDEERFKTWGALIVGVIVSVCSFWGYKSMVTVR